MEVSALKYSGGIGLHARSPLLRLQSDEKLVALVRRGSGNAFEVLVGRYESRLLAFCRHLLGSREDAEDVLQDVFAAAFNAMTADTRPINVRPWLYRIARNRSLNHLRRIQATGVDSMDVHLSENGASTADKVHEREEFRLLVGDIHELPETQKTALVLREMDALSYEQIAEAMETTVPSVKSLLVRARVSLAEAAEARLLSCDEVRIELGEVAEGLRRRPSPLVRRHLRACERCSAFRSQLKETNKALAAIMPIGPLVVIKKLIVTHLSHSAGSSATSAGAAGSSAAAGSTLVAGSGAGGFISAGMGAIATKAAAGLAAAALVTAGAVEVDHSGRRHGHSHAQAALPVASVPAPAAPATHARTTWVAPGHHIDAQVKPALSPPPPAPRPTKPANSVAAPVRPETKAADKPTVKAALTKTTTSPATKPPLPPGGTKTTASLPAAPEPPPGRTQTENDPTLLAPTQANSSAASPTSTAASASGPTIAPVSPPYGDPGPSSAGGAPPTPPAPPAAPPGPSSGSGTGTPAASGTSTAPPAATDAPHASPPADAAPLAGGSSPPSGH
ncbi:MAG: sigma-70 family RNA polymerase sigma factor [Solirubrobacterales bacterium]|nr:sigma-70 family RNA polymerase sigma factor [Solirubrobacterales bacterium]MBV9337682.1 sigma-70 family RNA polymerase sigma factor [Solirubrobacterales bacterium]